MCIRDRSGGSTAQQLFKLWVKEYRNNIPWDILRFYWVDERCVSPEDDESNFKHAERLLFMPLDIPQNHIHRIWGEQEPKVEAERYSEMVKWELPGYSNMPRFDCTILGIGADGHVASIFSCLLYTSCLIILRFKNCNLFLGQGRQRFVDCNSNYPAKQGILYS